LQAVRPEGSEGRQSLRTRGQKGEKSMRGESVRPEKEITRFIQYYRLWAGDRADRWPMVM
jgi:hypothetical protein